LGCILKNMIANISNQDFGYSVATDGYWAAVGNPNPFRYNSNTQSFIRTGSVEIYQYNINSDIHDDITTIYRPLYSFENVLLTTELNNQFTTPIASGPYWYLQTEYTGSIPITADMNLM